MCDKNLQGQIIPLAHSHPPFPPGWVISDRRLFVIYSYFMRYTYIYIFFILKTFWVEQKTPHPKNGGKTNKQLNLRKYQWYVLYWSEIGHSTISSRFFFFHLFENKIKTWNSSGFILKGLTGSYCHIVYSLPAAGPNDRRCRDVSVPAVTSLQHKVTLCCQAMFSVRV